MGAGGVWRGSADEGCKASAEGEGRAHEEDHSEEGASCKEKRAEKRSKAAGKKESGAEAPRPANA
jgi:hypothetical protein